jgi:hypothetical protein
MEHGKKIRVVTQRGTLYLDVEGRPDGADAELPRFLARKHDVAAGFGEFALQDEDVQSLSEEAVLYRLRREYFLKVGDFVRAVRDVNIGIQIIELIGASADNPDLSAFFMQFRPDQEIFKCTAEARLAIQQKDYLLARQRMEAAAKFARTFETDNSGIFPPGWLTERLVQIKKVYDEIGELWENDLSPLRNTTLTLEQQMEAAVKSEHYERAAEIRDMIRSRDTAEKD